ncbi:hypothetical protein BAE44_0019264 [Dichanthelium oligosanthes]|uniref:Uncharacterized protein n=1 Tax=Dichanthelium oligosanthes TaxID=888268 RepID=A0A1E5V3R2_9POAL|nr:hypothetical protein BAE44_0019264 [Dichanthelium oligosanthes]
MPCAPTVMSWCSGSTGTVAGRRPRRSPSRRYYSDHGHHILATSRPSPMTTTPRRGIGQTGDDVWLLPFQGAEVEVVLLAGGRRMVAFDAVTRRRREAVLRGEPASTDWGAAASAAHTNTLMPIEPVVLMEPPDDQEAAL